jgi:predicted phosphodiesterase
MGELLDSIRPVRDNKKLTDQELLEELQARGYLAHKPAPAVKPVEFDLGRLRGDRVRIGVISDTHFGSKFQQPSLLVEHLRYMKRRKVDVVMVGGDVTDGSTKMHPGFEYELWAHGSDAQVQAAADVLVPEAQRLKVPWFFIGGNHDFSHWKSAGVDVIAQLCRESEWFRYISPGGANARGSIGHLKFGRLAVQICHPHMGSAYALSYRPQKWIEQLSSENKPHLVLMGNFHKCLQLDYRNVFALLLPSFQAQSAWMASKGISSYIGSCILEVGMEPKGMTPSVQVEWLLERVPKEKDWPGTTSY